MNPPSKPSKQTRLGLSAWITQELVEETLQTWQPYYKERLTEADAIEILQNFGRLVDCLQEPAP